MRPIQHRRAPALQALLLLALLPVASRDLFAQPIPAREIAVQQGHADFLPLGPLYDISDYHHELTVRGFNAAKIWPVFQDYESADFAALMSDPEIHTILYRPLHESELEENCAGGMWFRWENSDYGEIADDLYQLYGDLEKVVILTGWEQDHQFENRCGWGNGGITEEEYLKLVDSRQLGVSGARAANLDKSLRVYHAVELNNVPDSPGGVNVLMRIVANMAQSPDLISYSAWAALTNAGVVKKLNTIQTVSGLARDRIFIGEFGWDRSTPNLTAKIRSYADTVFGWGSRLMFWWSLANDGRFAMIDTDGAVHAGIENGLLGAHDEWATEPPGPCRASASVMCLRRDRIKLELRWIDFAGTRGIGHVAPFGTDESGLFWFFAPSNLEFLVKVLDGCAFNQSLWVLASATTNVAYALTVTDTASGLKRVYTNPLGNTAPALVDIGAFPACQFPTGADPGSFGTPYQWSTGPGCAPSPTRHCFRAGRFKVELTWRNFEGQKGPGRVVPYGTEESGLFWFFDADNWELLIKVLDGCGFNSRYWVFASATTNVEFDLTVTDTLSGLVRTYHNPSGQNAETILDVEAFASCP